MEKIYMDYNASTPLAPEVVNAMQPLLQDYYGNPSALHWSGKPGKELLHTARGQVAELIACSPREIIFTSGGSEANNLALKGYYFKNKHKGKQLDFLGNTGLSYMKVWYSPDCSIGQIVVLCTSWRNYSSRFLPT